MVLDTGQIPISDTCQADRSNFLGLNNSFLSQLDKKGPQDLDMSTRVTARTK